MQKEINIITQHLFRKGSLDEVAVPEIERFLEQHPYASAVRYLLAKKKFSTDPATLHPEVVTAGLYLHNPLRLQWLLENDEEAGETREEHNSAADPSSSPIVFQSYHTIDYFASQGIRLQQSELDKDRLGQQLKSFTEWLKSMKKLPSSQQPENMADDSQQQVIRTAAHSLDEKEVLTETMAQVWAKQGNTARAIDIYEKLSLQNPGKRAYFAARIDQLKAV